MTPTPSVIYLLDTGCKYNCRTRELGALIARTRLTALKALSIAAGSREEVAEKYE